VGDIAAAQGGKKTLDRVEGRARRALMDAVSVLAFCFYKGVEGGGVLHLKNIECARGALDDYPRATHGRLLLFVFWVVGGGRGGSVEEAQHLATQALAAGLVVVHDACVCGGEGGRWLWCGGGGEGWVSGGGRVKHISGPRGCARAPRCSGDGGGGRKRRRLFFGSSDPAAPGASAPPARAVIGRTGRIAPLCRARGRPGGGVGDAAAGGKRRAAATALSLLLRAGPPPVRCSPPLCPPTARNQLARPPSHPLDLESNSPADVVSTITPNRREGRRRATHASISPWPMS